VSHPISFVAARGHSLEYIDIAATRPEHPDLLLLHEGLGSVSLWRDFPGALAQATGCRVVAYSRAGFGRSSPRRAPFSIRFMHEEALEILPELREKLALRDLVLVGHSTGASMALIHAAGSRVAGVVAMAPFAFVEDTNVAAIAATRTRYAHIRERLGRHHDDVDAMFRDWTELWLDPGFKAWSIEADLAGLRCPVLAILGARDEYCTPAQVERIERSAPRAHFELLALPESGHAPHRDAPDAVLAAINRFIEKLEA
jgi:pimeloyl-ACP methyl ester carboxylesterase